MDPLAERDIAHLRAGNPGPFTLSGTNSYLVGRDPVWLIDPGPALGSHLDALVAGATERGGLAGIVLTHDHADHAEAIAPLRERLGPVQVAAARGPVDVQLGDGDRLGPLEALHLPGHAPDHLALLAGDTAFAGDAVLGEGSVFITPHPGALTAYLAGLERLRRRRPALLCPGHGPLVTDPDTKLSEYLVHRRAREDAVLLALGRGRRSVDELLDDAWGDVPAPLRPAAAITLAAHLDRLAEEGRLPDGVQRPEVPDWLLGDPTAAAGAAR